MVTATAAKKQETNGSGVVVRGTKLQEAADYVKAARLALLMWTKEAYLGADQVDRHLEDIQDCLGWSEALQKMRERLEVKASVFGR